MVFTLFLKIHDALSVKKIGKCVPPFYLLSLVEILAFYTFLPDSTAIPSDRPLIIRDVTLYLWHNNKK